MAFRNEADEIRALGMLLAKGYVYRGLKPVNWCFDCGSALAEAEVEYEDRRTSPSMSGFPSRSRKRSPRAFGLAQLPPKPGFIVIWTTTPWTLPANQALNVHPEFEYALVETDEQLLIVAREILLKGAEEGEGSPPQESAMARRYGLTGWRILGSAPGRRSKASHSAIRSTNGSRRSISAIT
jgi:isoleucyl-tRNA synthetase